MDTTSRIEILKRPDDIIAMLSIINFTNLCVRTILQMAININLYCLSTRSPSNMIGSPPLQTVSDTQMGKSTTILAIHPKTKTGLTCAKQPTSITFRCPNNPPPLYSFLNVDPSLDRYSFTGQRFQVSIIRDNNTMLISINQ